MSWHIVVICDYDYGKDGTCARRTIVSTHDPAAVPEAVRQQGWQHVGQDQYRCPMHNPYRPPLPPVTLPTGRARTVDAQIIQFPPIHLTGDIQ